VNLVTLESLKIFCDVVRQKSFSRGAAMNSVSQSAASQAILQLEKRLGVQLIDRSQRPLALTAEGEIYYKECRSLVDRYLAVESRIQTRHNAELSRVNVASIYSVVLYNMNRYVQRFHERYPHYQVRFHYLHPDDVYESVRNGEADLGLISFPHSRREFEVVQWRNEPMVLVCSLSHPFARLRQIGVDQLNGVDFVAFDPNLAIGRYIDRFFRQHNVAVNVVMAFDNIEFIKRGIETGSAVAILPEPTVSEEVRTGKLRIVTVPKLDLARPLCIIHRRKRVLTPAILGFISILKEAKAEPRTERRSPIRKINDRIKE